MRPFGNETGRANRQPSSVKPMEGLLCLRKGKLRLPRTATQILRPPAFRGARCQSSHVLTWLGLTVGRIGTIVIAACKCGAGAGHFVQAAVSPRGPAPRIESYARCGRR